MELTKEYMIKHYKEGMTFWGCCYLYKYQQDNELSLKNILNIYIEPIQLKISSRPVIYNHNWIKAADTSNQQQILEVSITHDFLCYFNTEQECINYYNDCVWESIQECNEKIAEFQKLLNDYHSKFYKTDFLIEKLRRE